MDKSLKYRFVAWAVAIFLILLLPGGINTSSQIQRTSIATALGIDEGKNGLEVSVQVIVPQPSTSYSPKYVITSAEGKNLPEAIENIELKLGQQLGLTHCFVVVLGDKICYDDVTNTLDFLMRSNIMGNNSALLHTDGTAKELLKQSSKLSESDINNLQNIAKYNQEHYSSSNTDLMSFFNNYASTCPFSVVGSLNVDSDETQNQSQKNNQQSEQSQNNQPESSDNIKVLKNEGKAVVFKKGKKIATLEKTDLTKLGWLDGKTKKGFLIMENVKNNIFDNATITLRIQNKSVNFVAKLENNNPVLEANISFDAFVDSVEDKGETIFGAHQNWANKDFLSKIEEKIKTEIREAIDLSKEKKFDVANIFKTFNSQQNKKWKQYLKTLENPEDYILNVEVETNISMKQML